MRHRKEQHFAVDLYFPAISDNSYNTYALIQRLTINNRFAESKL